MALDEQAMSDLVRIAERWQITCEIEAMREAVAAEPISERRDGALMFADYLLEWLRMGQQEGESETAGSRVS